ncbi:helix-turn-helix domain-containing protein [Natrinema salaciae]|uniref:helix-turn-helix domain-containing protein n=1 Tax=Natrinema salaciae TaxID=1186196 RepID=UPI0031845CD5
MFKVLEINGTMTQSQIATKSRLSKRTVRQALDNLRDADTLDERVSLRDARKSLYSIPESRETDTLANASD